MTLIHIHDESQQDMGSCNMTGREGPKHQTEKWETIGIIG